MVKTVYSGWGGHRQSQEGPSPANSVAVLMLSPEVVLALSVFGQKLLVLPRRRDPHRTVYSYDRNNNADLRAPTGRNRNRKDAS